MSDRGRRRPRREPEPWAGPEGFVPAGSPDHLAREKEEARKLRATRWWKEKLARGLCHWCGRAFPTSELTMDHVVKFEKELAEAGVENPVVAPILLPDYSTDEVTMRRMAEAIQEAE